MRHFSAFVLFGVLFCPSARADLWWRDAVFYEIFTRSFQDSNGDGIGDLRGIARRLDYVKSLGAGGIWLTPVFDSPSYHGYDAIDYRRVNKAYGTNEDLVTLASEAHRRGMRLVLDLAVNHSSDKNPWFEDLHDWYVWRPTKPSWGKWFPLHDEFYFSVFGAPMPQLNWRLEAVRDEVRSIMAFWRAKGIDGFRLDAARYYVPGPKGEADTPETHRYIREFAESIRAEFPDTLFVGEIWADSKTIASYHQGGQQLDLAFSFPIAGAVIDAIRKKSATSFATALTQNLQDFGMQEFNAPFLTNHDMVRAATQLGGDLEALKLAAAVYLFLPGTPFVYYGEEIGLANAPEIKDMGKRTPMPWDDSEGHGFTEGKPWQPFQSQADEINVATQDHDESSLLNHYRRLIKTRNHSPILRRGHNVAINVLAGGRAVAWQRRHENQTAIIVANFSNQPLPEIKLTLDGITPSPTISAHTLWGSGTAVPHSEAGLLTLTLPPLAARAVAAFQLD